MQPNEDAADDPHASAELKAKLEAPRTPVVPLRPETIPPDPNAPSPEGIVLRPVALDFGTHRPGSLVGWLAAGPATDVLWTDEALYLMTEKGKPRLAWQPVGLARKGRFSSVSFDGKYVWLTYSAPDSPMLVVLDPASGRVWDASKAEGLPRPPVRKDGGAPETGPGGSALMACGVEDGRACLSGWFAGRGWVGLATFDRDAGAVSVKVTHEAREVAERDEKAQDKEAWRKTTYGFQPAFLGLLAGPPGPDGKPARRVLLVRSAPYPSGLSEHPLVLRADGTVEGPMEARVAFDRAVDPHVATGAIGDTIRFGDSSAKGRPGGDRGSLRVAAARLEDGDVGIGGVVHHARAAVDAHCLGHGRLP